jgi:hypothetical protein
MKIKLAYFNIVLIVGYFGFEFSLGSVNPVLSIGLVTTLWYNWETLKRLKGQPSKFNRINVLIGLAVLMFAALTAAEGFYKIIIQQQVSYRVNEFLILGFVQIIIGFSNLLITAKTINIYWKTKAI